MKGKIFTAQEVQAIIAGNKTMFRRISNSLTNEKDLIEAIKEKEWGKYDKETNYYILSRIYWFCTC